MTTPGKDYLELEQLRIAAVQAAKHERLAERRRKTFISGVNTAVRLVLFSVAVLALIGVCALLVLVVAL